MKKLLTLIICIGFLSCSKKSEHPSQPVSTPTILGTWYLSSDTSYTYDNGQLIQTIEHTYGPNNTDNIIKYDQTGTATVIALVNKPVPVIDTIPFAYNVVGDSIYYYNGLKSGFIRQLSSTQLTLYFDISGIVNYYKDGKQDGTVFQRITTVDHYRR